MSRNILYTFLGLLLTASAARSQSLPSTVSLLPEEHRHAVVQQLGLAEGNAKNLLAAVIDAKPEHRAALGYLIANMPERDLTTLSKRFLLSTVEYAYKTRSETPWGKTIPDELFFSDVLPYANLNERRDDWRKDFYERFMPLVKDCKTSEEAVLILNKAVFKLLDVKYHPTKRPKPDQSPYESIEAHFASCTGLSILLVDACRAVGIPAHVVGTPQWKTGGNHTWVEVWHRQWNFIGSCEAGNLNETWFAGPASKADEKLEHRIYAASFTQTSTWFPLIWDLKIRYVTAHDVTPFYNARRTVTIRIDKPLVLKAPTTVTLRQNGRLVAMDTGEQLKFALATGLKFEVELQSGSSRCTREITPRADGEGIICLMLTE